MNVKIYRGTHQIGGSVTGISTGKTRVIIDMGKPLLSGKSGERENLRIDEPYNAVVFTHYHGDHTGLMEDIASNIPLYIGEGARELFLASEIHKGSGKAERIKSMRTYKDGRPFFVGDLKITPILTDHSAFDSYMMLVEGEGKRVLHTGDFRTHGIKGDMVIPAAETLRGKVDLLITEGTNLSYRQPVVCSERDLGKAASVLGERYKYVFCICDPLDIDRLAIFRKSAEKKGVFLCDAFQMSLMEIAEKYGKSVSDSYNFEGAKVYYQGIEAEKNGFFMAVRPDKDFASLLKPYREKYSDKSLLIYSMSEGYLKRHEQEVRQIADGFPYFVKLHTSGHASSEAIWQLINALQPEKLTVIHTEKPENLRAGALQNRAVYLEDGDSFDI